MESFTTFYEKRERNPLRKKELAGGGTNLDYVNRLKDVLPPERQEQIRKMEELGVEPERIETFKVAKLKEWQKHLNTYLRPKIDNKEYTKILERFGIQVFVDRTIDKSFVNPYNLRILKESLDHLVIDYKDILPNRKPRIIITDMNKNPEAKIESSTGLDSITKGFYYQRLIFIDFNRIKDKNLFVHEYAHYVADLIPSQTEKILQDEYKKMLDSYFQRNTRMKNLEGISKLKVRNRVAKKLGLPTPYSTVNYDEFFAEVITHWKKLPNNPHVYRFKTAMKKVLNRL